MAWARIRKFAFVALSGGMLLQTGTTGCQETFGALAAEVATSILLNALLGGLTT